MSHELLSFLYFFISVLVGVILVKQIRVQKTIIAKYEIYSKSIDPTKALNLKDEEVAQIENNFGNDRELLQKQVYELSSYINEILNNVEKIREELGDDSGVLDKSSTIVNYMPSCKKIFDSYEK